ncbi:hypothetical protein DL766_001228 [Monosporascus sp. MC13-8B]|uniref:feruloyl esterase n=1 Tax=Monosporascus cannonballus TaxID=155416 RepID=A0ABY0HJJ3_9PEZI|nr:hypothetical protein DL762_000359 [Monosporascus cannonballus]RYO96940.1 hypothetical protein DL763_002977 [Monosporascus cannonballus]RYP37931.1 hypothetical protein DL766_001228 [Monosporascus sp. MC13-8B]
MHWRSGATSSATHLLLLVSGQALAAPAPAPAPAPETPVRAASAGCGAAPNVVDGDSRLYRTTAGRAYRVFLPHDYNENTPAPLILSYHGAGGVIDQQAELDRLARLEVNKDHIVVYLQGNADDPSQPQRYTWQGAPENHSDDISFTREVLNAVLAAYCVDPSRVYATGMSQGGGFVGRLACSADMSARIAAYAPVAGAFYQKQVDEEEACKPATVDVGHAWMSRSNGGSNFEASEWIMGFFRNHRLT